MSTARNAFVVLVATSTAAVLYKHDMEPFSLSGNITGGIPLFVVPEFSWTHDNQTLTFVDNIKVYLLSLQNLSVKIKINDNIVMEIKLDIYIYRSCLIVGVSVTSTKLV
jgi:hypothetical protein